MKEYKNIDQVFEDAAKGFEPALSDDVWAGLEKDVNFALAAKTNNYSFKKYAALLLILLLSGTSIWFFLSSPFDTSSQKEIGAKQNEVVVENFDNQLNNEKLIESETIKNIENNEILSKKGINKNEFEMPISTNGYASVENANQDTDNSFTYRAQELWTKSDEDMSLNLDDIQKLNSRSIYDLAYADYRLADRKIDLEAVLEKRKKLHSYTSISAKAAMMYYPNTRDQFTYSVDAGFGLIFNRFYVETGLGYQKIKERGILSYTYKTNDSIGFYNRVVSFEINPANPEEITYKITKTTVYDSLVHVNEQSPLFYYDYVNLPIKFGYKVWDKKKLSLSIETGLIFSKLISSKIPDAEFYAPESTLLKIEDKTPARVDINYQWQLGLRFNYKILNSLSISLQPEFSKYLNSIYKNENSNPQTKPYTMGVRFGICYDF